MTERSCLCGYLPEMPGGYLSFGIYQSLGGERDFGTFWRQLGLPVILLIAACYALLVRGAVMSQRVWMIGSAAGVASMATAVGCRAIH
jgi:hypothetical protein